MHLYEAEDYIDYIGKDKDRAILEKNERRSEDPEGVLLGFLGGGVPPCCLNSDPISDQKMSFSTPVLRPGEAEITMSSLERLRIARTANLRNFQNEN